MRNDPELDEEGYPLRDLPDIWWVNELQVRLMNFLYGFYSAETEEFEATGKAG